MSWLIIAKTLLMQFGPAIKEWWMGYFKHPYKNKKGKKPPYSFFIILILAAALWYAVITAIDLHEENRELEFQLRLRPDNYINSEEAFARFTEDTQKTFDLMICEQRLAMARRDSGSSEQLLYEERKMRRDVERRFLEYQTMYNSCPTEPARQEVKEPNRTDFINRRLDRLRQQGGN